MCNVMYKSCQPESDDFAEFDSVNIQGGGGGRFRFTVALFKATPLIDLFV